MMGLTCCGMENKFIYDAKIDVFPRRFMLSNNNFSFVIYGTPFLTFKEI